MSHHKCCCEKCRCSCESNRCNCGCRKRRCCNSCGCGFLGGLGASCGYGSGCGALWPLILLFGCCGNRRDC